MEYPVGERKELLDFYLICKHVCWFFWMLAFVYILGILKREECFNYPSRKSLRRVLYKGSDYSYEPMCEREMIL